MKKNNKKKQKDTSTNQFQVLCLLEIQRNKMAKFREIDHDNEVQFREIEYDNESDWETDDERANRIHREFFEKTLVLMTREPPLDIFFKSVDITGMINLCCNFESVAEILKCRKPEIAALYNSIDFGKIYGTVDTSIVRSMMNHFKPKTVILESTVILPTDLLRAFTLNSPKSLTIKLRSFGQQLVMKRNKIEEVCIENFIYDSTSSVNNTILESSSRIAKIEIINGSIDDITTTLLGQLSLERLDLKNVEIRCRDMDALARNISKQVWTEKLRVNCFGELNNTFIPFLLDRIASMNLKTLEISLGDNLMNIDNISKISSLTYVRLNVESHSHIEIFQQLLEIFILRPDVTFAVFLYCSCGVDVNETIAYGYFGRLENVFVV